MSALADDFPAAPVEGPPDREEQALQDILDRWYGDDLGPA